MQRRVCLVFLAAILLVGSLLTPASASPTASAATAPTAQVIAHLDPTVGAPRGGLIRGQDGNLYGLTTRPDAGGILFRVTPTGTRTTVGSFPCNDVGSPCAEWEAFAGGLLQGADGNFYFYVNFEHDHDGVTRAPIYRMSPSGALTELAPFGQGIQVVALVRGPDSAVYGLTVYMPDATAAAFRIGTDGSFQTLAYFDRQTTGLGPTSLVLGGDGAFYGLTSGGGAHGYGTFFRLTTAGALTVLAPFDGTNGGYGGTVVQGVDGTFLVSTTHVPGNLAAMQLDRFTSTGASTVLSVYPLTSLSPLVLSPDGNFYGIEYVGTVSTAANVSYGVPAAVTPSGVIVQVGSVARSDGFAVDPAEGGYFADAPLAVDPSATVYGTTGSFAFGQYGTVYRLPAPGLTVNAIPGNHQLDVRWTSVTGATTYRVYVSAAAGAAGTLTTTTAGNETVLAGRANGTYYVTVAAVSGTRELARSAQVSALVNTPDPFTFTSATNAAAKTMVVSNEVMITGLVAPAPISIASGRYSINGKSFTAKPGTIAPGDRLRVERKSAGAPNKTVTTTVTVGGVSAVFAITTGG